MKTPLIILIATVLIAAGACYYFTIGVKNDIIAQENAVEEKWAEIDSLLLSRNEKLTKLAAPVKKYMAHETAIFDKILEARARYAGGATKADKMAADGELTSALSRLLVVSEQNPDIKADKLTIGLFDEIAGMENRLARARSEYNKSVRSFNTTILQWPGNRFGFEKKDYFQVAENKKADVDMDNLLK